MSNARAPEYLLLWKGRQSGPFTGPVIREKLDSGEISRMHQVSFNGKWMVLDEFLEKHGGGDPEARRLDDLRKREEQLRNEFEGQLAAPSARTSWNWRNVWPMPRGVPPCLICCRLNPQPDSK